MATGKIDNSIAKAAAAPAKKQKKRRFGRMTGVCAALFFIAVLLALSINSVIALASDGYKWTVKNSAVNSFLSFTQTAAGLTVMIVCILLIVAVWALSRYIIRIHEKKKTVIAALQKSQDALSRINLRYDNINEVTAVLDVLSMITEKPKNKKEAEQTQARMLAFIKAENIALPQTPETAAILDSLPAPDTPGSLAAALSAGATLRQAEDGQTLVLTTISGGKNILLTPVQTADGIILCQQGARIKSELAPNLEDIGFTSMPASPEFFEGLPLEKNVEYPELPEPHTFGPEMLSGETSVPAQKAGMLSSPTPTAKSGYVALGAGDDGKAILGIAEHGTSEIPAPELADKREPDRAADKQAAGERLGADKTVENGDADITRQAENGDTVEARAAVEIAKLRGAYSMRSADVAAELAEVRRLNALLADADPLSGEEKRRVDEFKASRKKQAKKKEISPEAQEEKKQKAKLAAQKRKAEKEAFLSSLTPEDRELYVAEQKLKRSRQAAIRKLKKMEADRKLLQKMDED